MTRDAQICDCGDHGFVALTRGATSYFSPEDIDLVAAGHWSATGTVPRLYAARRNDGGKVLLHRAVARAKPGEVVDHLDRDTLNNQRSNLRCCTHSQNLANQGARTGKTSAFKGVSRHRDGAWIAQICKEYQSHNLGSFASDQEAARAYDKAAVELHGNFALTNEALGLLKCAEAAE